MKYDYLLDDLKKEVLVFDIETSAFYPDGKEVNLKTNYDDYIKYAQVKWFGAYSYKYKKGFIYTYKDFNKIQKLFYEHSILAGFNSEEFDFPICKNNFLINDNMYYTQVDCMQILGKSVFKNRSGFQYKDRGSLMNYKFKNNSLKIMAEEMGLETQKGEINYKIFAKESWNSNEEKEIKKYLKTDILATKQMFEKLWEYWLPFTDLLDVKFIKNLSWIRNSIASLTYKCACSLMEVEPTYSEHKKHAEEMGGRVILPKIEEAKNVWYIDFASLYPHVMTQFNLFAETCEREGEFVWHGNDLFKVKGYYNISKPHPLNVQVQEKLKERIELKKNDKNNPMIYCLKIFLNALYGAGRSSIFEQIHTQNFGWDVCWLGQQIQEFTEKKMKEFGFETIAGDTDSLFALTTDESLNNEKYVKECLNKIVKEIKENVPFPVETFSIDIEAFIDYILFPFSLQPIQNENGDNIKKGNRLIKERKGKKKNYLYIYTEEGEKKVKLVGLPIKKDNATALGIKIYHEVLESLILKENRAKFDEKFIKETVNKYLQNDEIMSLISREFKCKSYHTYKNPESQLQAQISKEYFNENDGIIRLIKNTKIGKVGKGCKYCTVKEAIDNNLTLDELELDKLWNELEPFIESKNVETKKEVKRKVKKPVVKSDNEKIIKEAVKKVCHELAKDDKACKKLADDYCNVKKEVKEFDFNISHCFKTQAKVTDRTVLIAEAFGLGIDDEKEFHIYKDFNLKCKSNDIIYVTGDSGSGKSWILKNIFAKQDNAISIDEIKIDENEILIEGVGKDLNDALKKLNTAGLGDAFLYLRSYNQLSDGQKYRYKIAKFIDSEKDIWLLDEFCAKLDRTTAKIVAYNLQKIARRMNKMVICATTHEDLVDALKPDIRIFKGYESEVQVTRYKKEDFSNKLSEIYDNLKVEKGTKKDYEKLKQFHYRQSKLGAVKDYYKLTYLDDTIGVIVITYPHLALKGRNIFNDKKYSKMTKENCEAINREYECIARVILSPKYRGLGLSYYFIKEYFKLSESPYIETVAVMSKYSPFFERAGMTHIETEQDTARSDKIAQLEDFGFNTSLLSSARYNESIFETLSQEQQEEVKNIVKKILNRYKGQIVKLFSKDKSIDDIVEENLFDVMKEIQRADTWYWIYENKKNLTNAV